MQLFFIKTCLLTLCLTLFNNIYSVRISTLNGADIPLSVFEGKKILVVLLPTTQTSEDSSFLRAINNIGKSYSGKISVIAVPSFEDGYSAANAKELRNFYNGLLSQQVIVTEGVFTRKSSPSQHELFKWLTHAAKNTHFDMDAEGPREKFFINEQGNLFAVVDAKTNLTPKLIQKALQ